MLNKIQENNATGVCVLPNWKTQAWFPKAMKMILQEPVVFNASKTLVHLPNQPITLHPLHKKLTLLICLLSKLSRMTKISVPAKEIIMAS